MVLSKGYLKKVFEYLPIIVMILITANVATFVTSRFFIFATLIVSALAFYLKGYKIHSFILLLSIYWLIINVLSYFYNGTAESFFSHTSIKASYYYIFTAYFLLVLSSNNFFMKLEKIIFVLTVLSFPFYTMEFIAPSIMQSITAPISSTYSDIGGWYIGIYFHSPAEQIRNCGFMWEPGAFAMMMIIASVIHLRQNGIRFDYRFLVYFIGIITTLSTMGYVVLFLLLSLVIFLQKRFFLSVLLLISSVIAFPIVANLDFVLPEIQQHVINGENMKVGREKSTHNLRINRYAMVLLSINESLKWPFGNGIIMNKNMLDIFGERVVGVGAVQYTLVKWGWIGLVFLIFTIRKSVINFGDNKNLSSIATFIFVLSILISLATNPIEDKPIFYALVFYPFIMKKTKREKNIKFYKLTN